MKQRIEKAVKEALVKLGAGKVTFVVERPASMEHGDYSTNAALVAAKVLKQNPREVAQKLVDAAGAVEGVEKIEIAGAGFINFLLTKEALIPKEAAIEQVYAGKTVMVEYTDPNPFKEFHIGHLMSNAVGEAIARLLEKTGAKVTRANYQGDIGPHVAKAIWGKMQKPELSWGDAYVHGNEQYEAHEKDIDALNVKIYDKSDAEVNALYDAGRKESLEHFEELYKTLGTKFDHYFFESETGPRGLKIVKNHPEIFEESEGAIIYRGAHTRVFVTSLGIPTYEAKELGLVEVKKEKGNFDLSLTVTANETKDFFAVVRDAAEKIFPDLEGKMIVRFHGLMKLTTGKMSSRLGNVITGESLLEDLTKAARGREDVAVGAVKYAVLKQGSGRDIVFDPEKSLSLEGDSGPYLQYARVRARSVLKKVSPEPVIPDIPEKGFWMLLARVLVHYPEVVARAAKEMEPHYLTTYLTELASVFNSWYGTEQFIVDGKILGIYKKIIEAFEQTMKEGLELLGIPTPEEM